MRTPADLTAQLAAQARALQPLRGTSPLANDFYEAADDWNNLGTLLAERSDRTDFASRARQEQELLNRLRAAVRQASLADQARYQPVLEAGAQLIDIAARQIANPDGLLGFLRIVREHFALLANRGFALVLAKPSAARFASTDVFVQLALNNDPSFMCTVGAVATPDQSFGLDDLLFLNSDLAWQRFAEPADLHTEAQVDRWFADAAHLLQDYGADVLAGTPPIFDRLQDARDRRDEALTQSMNRRYALKTQDK